MGVYHVYRMSTLKDPVLIYTDGDAVSGEPSTAALHSVALNCLRKILATNSATIRADLSEGRRWMSQDLATELDGVIADFAAKNGRSYAEDIERQAITTEFYDVKGVREPSTDATDTYRITLWGHKATYQDGRGKVDDRLFCYTLSLIPNPVSPANPLGVVVSRLMPRDTTPDGVKTANPMQIGADQPEAPAEEAPK